MQKNKSYTTTQMILRDTPPGGHRGGHLFLPIMVNATVYLGGYFLFTTVGIFARHGKSIYRGGRLKMSAVENRVFSATDILRRPPR